MSKSGSSAVPSQTVWIVTSPWLPAALPAMVLVTVSAPGVGPYVSVMAAVAVSAGGMVTSCGLPVVVTATVGVEPSAVSATVQALPAGMSGYVLDSDPVAPAAMMKSGVDASGPQSTWMVTGSWSPAEFP